MILECKNFIKKIVSYAGLFLLLLPLLVFCGFTIAQLSSLTEFSKVYIGEYRCIRADYGDCDLLKDCRSISLMLKKDGTFTVRVVERSGRTHSQSGEYEYDSERSVLTFRTEILGKTHKKSAILQNGTFVIEQRYANETLVLKFQIKA